MGLSTMKLALGIALAATLAVSAMAQDVAEAARQNKARKTVQAVQTSQPKAPLPKVEVTESKKTPEVASTRVEFVKEAQLALLAVFRSSESSEAKADARAKIDLVTVDSQTPAEEQASKTLTSVLLFQERLRIQIDTVGLKMHAAALFMPVGLCSGGLPYETCQNLMKASSPAYKAATLEGDALLDQNRKCYNESLAGFKKGDFSLPGPCGVK